jgi:hypothetical protein
MSEKQAGDLGPSVLICGVIVVCAICRGIYRWFLENQQAIMDALLSFLKLAALAAGAVLSGYLIFKWAARQIERVRIAFAQIDSHEDEISKLQELLEEQNLEIIRARRSAEFANDGVRDLKKFTDYDEVMELRRKDEEQRQKEAARAREEQLRKDYGENTPDIFDEEPEEEEQ